MEHLDQVIGGMLVQIDLRDNLKAIERPTLCRRHESFEIFRRTRQNEAAFELSFANPGENDATNQFFLYQNQAEAGDPEQHNDRASEQELRPFHEEQAESR